MFTLSVLFFSVPIFIENLGINNLECVMGEHLFYITVMPNIPFRVRIQGVRETSITPV